MRLSWTPEAALAALNKGMRKGVSEAGQNLARHVQTTKLNGTPLDVRTGTLRRSVVALDQLDRIAVRVGTNIPYARAHEFGAVITPKKGKWLTIPIGPMRVRSRTARFSSPKDIKQKLVFVRFNGKPMLARKVGTKAERRLEPLFLLVKRSVIPARPFLRPSLYETRQKSQALIALGVRREMLTFKRAGKGNA